MLDLIDGKKIIEFLIDQLKSSNLQQKIVAIPNDEMDDVLFNFLNSSKISCYRGSTFDVLDRYYKASKQFKSDIIIRTVSYTHLRAHETPEHLVWRLLG